MPKHFRIPAVVGALLICLTLAGTALAQERKIVGYYFPRDDGGQAGTQGFTPQMVRGDLLTHINYAFANIRAGEVVIGNPALDLGEKNHLGQITALRKTWPHLKVLMSVGGWTWSGEFSNVALDPAARKKFADSAVRLVRTTGIDGIDIDWEFPVAGGEEANARRPQDRENFTLLLQALREALDTAGTADGRHYLLTAALGNNALYLQNIEAAKVARILDWGNLMSYDFAGHWDSYAGHNAPLYNDPATRRPGASPAFNIASVVELFITAGFPADRLVLGMPFYAYSWRSCGAAHHGQQQDCSGKGSGTLEPGVLSFHDVTQRLVNRDGFVRYWNDTAKVPFLFNVASKEFVSYDDAESFGYKITYLKQRGLAGAMYWELSGDPQAVLQGQVAHQLGRP
jgi:chitinase